jgi:hypothetical protein
MLKVFLSFSIILSACIQSGCRTTAASRTKAVSFTSGKNTFLVHYENSSFVVQLCATDPEVSDLLIIDEDLVAAKAKCAGKVKKIGTKEFSENIKNQLLQPLSQIDFRNSKDGLARETLAKINSYSKSVSDLKEELELIFNDLPDSDPERASRLQNVSDLETLTQRLQLQYDQLQKAVEEYDTTGKSEALLALDIADTRQLDADLSSKALLDASFFLRLITADKRIYRLDQAKNVYMTRAILQLFGDDACEPGFVLRNGMCLMSCPSGFVGVPGDVEFQTADFCVMKYEASSSASGKIAAIPDMSQFAGVNQHEARTHCSSLGESYHLINNAEWMTLAKNAAAIGTNWTGGVVGKGKLYTGHSDNNPARACSASAFDNKAYVEGSTCDHLEAEGDDDPAQRRTFFLSNGEVVWDLSANLEEWVDYNNDADKPSSSESVFGGEYPTVVGSSSMPKNTLVPTHEKSKWWNDAWGTEQGVGYYNRGPSGYGGAMLRGSHYHDVRDGKTRAGIFNTNFNFIANNIVPIFGFRCAWRQAGQ